MRPQGKRELSVYLSVLVQRSTGGTWNLIGFPVGEPSLKLAPHVPIANFFHNPQQMVNANLHVVNCIKSSESTPLQPKSSHLWTFCVVCTGYSWGQLHSYCPSPTSWGLPLHLSCVGASVSWILCLPFSWFTHLSLWSTFFCSFLGKYTWVVKFLRPCISKMSLFYPHSGLKVYLGMEF